MLVSLISESKICPYPMWRLIGGHILVFVTCDTHRSEKQMEQGLAPGDGAGPELVVANALCDGPGLPSNDGSQKILLSL